MSTAINKYIYVTVKRHGDVFNEAIRINYSKSEQVQRIDEIKNNIARECLRVFRDRSADLHQHRRRLASLHRIGRLQQFCRRFAQCAPCLSRRARIRWPAGGRSFHIEIDVLKEPIGKQDQYAAAFGGFNLFCFKPGGDVTVEPVRLMNGNSKSLFESNPDVLDRSSARLQLRAHRTKTEHAQKLNLY